MKVKLKTKEELIKEYSKSYFKLVEGLGFDIIQVEGLSIPLPEMEEILGRVCIGKLNDRGNVEIQTEEFVWEVNKAMCLDWDIV